jgi:hypothetical protein
MLNFIHICSSVLDSFRTEIRTSKDDGTNKFLLQLFVSNAAKAEMGAKWPYLVVMYYLVIFLERLRGKKRNISQECQCPTLELNPGHLRIPNRRSDR